MPRSPRPARHLRPRARLRARPRHRVHAEQPDPRRAAGVPARVLPGAAHGGGAERRGDLRGGRVAQLRGRDAARRGRGERVDAGAGGDRGAAVDAGGGGVSEDDGGVCGGDWGGEGEGDGEGGEVLLCVLCWDGGGGEGEGVGESVDGGGAGGGGEGGDAGVAGGDDGAE